MKFPSPDPTGPENQSKISLYQLEDYTQAPGQQYRRAQEVRLRYDLCIKYCLTIFFHQVLFWLWKFGTDQHQDRHVQHVDKDTYLARM